MLTNGSTATDAESAETTGWSTGAVTVFCRDQETKATAATMAAIVM